MATLDWHLSRTDGVTLVELLVTSETDQGIRIESNLDPVWPPRSRGLPAPGWRDGAFEGHVEAGERLVVGYASPAPPVEPPAELRTKPPDSADGVSPRDLIRALGDAKPPRDAVPTANPRTYAGGDRGATDCREPGTASSRETACMDRPRPVPARFEPWLGAIESRLAEAERSPGAGPSGPGGKNTGAGRRGLDRQLAADRERLDALARRSRALVARLDALRVAEGNPPSAGESA